VAEPALPVLAALAAAAALVLGFLKTSIGGGIGLTLTPLLTLILPPSAVLGFLGCLMVLSDPISRAASSSCSADRDTSGRPRGPTPYSAH
jgi:uncharacterized membrane protein YfcA